MSTRKKESGSSRGTSPSPSGSPLRKTNPNPSSKTSRSLDSSPRTPNYLKPTASSSSSAAGDTTKPHSRKPVSNTDSALKPNLTRRRSFDKPPSPTRTLKSRGVSPTPTFRSSSFSSAKTATTSPRGERISSKGTTAGKQQHSLYARPVGTVKKSTAILGKKSETQAKTGSSRKQPKPDNHNVRGQEKEHHEDQESHHSYEPSQGEIDEDTNTITQQLEAEIQKAHSPSFLQQGDIAKEEESPHKVESPPVICEEDHGDAKAESPKADEEEEEEEEEMEDKSCIDEQEMKEQSDSETTNPGDEKEEGEASEVDDAENAGPKETHGKKDAALSNDVIEETANKLRKQNSRVRALAGAFETVISLQEPK